VPKYARWNASARADESRRFFGRLLGRLKRASSLSFRPPHSTKTAKTETADSADFRKLKETDGLLFKKEFLSLPF
jgi:hypothetical protein